MDYAKGIYHIDLPKALEFLEIAREIFIQTNQKRRHLDCSCEINYVNFILNNTSIFELESCSENLNSNGLKNQYVKSLLKISACLLITGRDDGEKVKYLLDKVVSLNNSLINPRLKMIFSNIYSALQLKYGNTSQLNFEINEHKKLASSAGNSYFTVSIHNVMFNNENSEISWFNLSNKNEESLFFIDPRIW